MGDDIEDWVPRDVDLRTPPDPEGSNGKQDPSGAAGAPGLSHHPRDARWLMTTGGVRSYSYLTVSCQPNYLSSSRSSETG